MFEFFNPKRRELSRVKSWFIKPHRVRQIYTRPDGSKYPDCCDCQKVFEYGDLAFYCITSPIRIVGYSAVGKLCFKCGIIRLAKITSKNQLSQLQMLELEYKGA